MKEKINEVLSERKNFTVDVAKDIGDNRIAVTRYLSIKAKVNDNILQLDGIGDINIQESQVDVTSLGFVKIKTNGCSTGDLITIM